MATTTILAQSAPAATTLNSLYTIPLTFRGSVYVIVTNTSATSANYRIAFVPSGETLQRMHYQVYDSTVGSTPQATRKMALAAGTTIWVYGSTADLNFCVNGIEQDV